MKIAVRVNVDSDTGYGHIFRCLNLAAKLKENDDEVLFLTNTNELVKEFKSHFIDARIGSAEELLLTANILKDFAPEALILDIFPEEKRAPADYSYKVNYSSHILSFVDSDDDFAPETGITINPNPLYTGNTVHQNCFCGLDFFLVNPEFHRSNNIEKSIFVSLGSVDEKNNLPDILTVLSERSIKQVEILASPYASYAKDLETIFSRYPQMDIKWHANVPSGKLCKLINNAEFCITNGGNVMLEMMFLLKKIISIPSNGRLVQLTEWCANKGGVLKCADITNLGEVISKINSFQPNEIIDGKGLDRIVELIHRNC